MPANRGAQVVAIGNAFELVHQNLEPYAKLTDLAKVDECHFGQKSAFWATRHGFPSIVVTTLSPTTTVLDSTFADQPRPAFIEPSRATSSISVDLLADSASWSTLTSLLDRKRNVFLAPYVHSLHVEALAAKLISKGYSLCDYRPQASLVRQLWNKVVVQQSIFEQIGELRQHRPRALVAASAQELQNAARRLSQQGVRQLVVKSATAVGGAGIFFVEPVSVTNQDLSLCQLLIGSGQNEPDRSAPFLVEERVDWDVSPTVDIEIMPGSQVEIVGLALQRLYDERYYTGFHASPRLEGLWWHNQVLHLARIVGRKLSSLGYVGPANIDFVVSGSPRRITLIELNPRRSALLDGFGIRKMICRDNTSPISVADYVNISQRFTTLAEAFGKGLSGLPGIVLPVADGGFLSGFRWAGVWSTSKMTEDSEHTLASAIIRLQDPARDEVGSPGRQIKSTIFSGNAA